jgi:hypothetical protein
LNNETLQILRTRIKEGLVERTAATTKSGKTEPVTYWIPEVYTRCKEGKEKSLGPD